MLRTMLRRSAAVLVVVLCVGGTAAMARTVSPSASATSRHPLITYRLGSGKYTITLTVAASGSASIVDRSKPKTYHFTLGSSALMKLKDLLADASIAKLKGNYPFTGPPIACGTDDQRLKAKGRTINVAAGPPHLPAGLNQLLQKLLNIVDARDPVPVPGAHTAQRCA